MLTIFCVLYLPVTLDANQHQVLLFSFNFKIMDYTMKILCIFKNCKNIFLFKAVKVLQYFLQCFKSHLKRKKYLTLHSYDLFSAANLCTTQLSPVGRSCPWFYKVWMSTQLVDETTNFLTCRKALRQYQVAKMQTSLHTSECLPILHGG